VRYMTRYGANRGIRRISKNTTALFLRTVVLFACLGGCRAPRHNHHGGDGGFTMVASDKPLGSVIVQ